MQDQAFGELEKNSDKLQQGMSSSDSSQPAHLHQLLCSLQKQLLAYCHINSVTEVWTQNCLLMYSLFKQTYSLPQIRVLLLGKLCLHSRNRFLELFELLGLLPLGSCD